MTVDYDDYDFEKAANMAQMVAEYQAKSDKRTNKRIEQRVHDARILVKSAVATADDETIMKIVGCEYSIEGDLDSRLTDWTRRFYDNLKISMVRKYAELYDKKSVKKYKTVPLPSLIEVMADKNLGR